MAKKKQLKRKTDTASSRTFDSSFWKLTYFLGTTEEWYGKQVKIL